MNSPTDQKAIPRFHLSLAVLIALFAYFTPWLVNSGASLSADAYDLAEWASLHPAARVSTPLLLTSFLLRLPPVCMVIFVALNIRPSYTSHRRLAVLFVMGTAVGLLPPLEFFSQASADLNYRQQFALASIAFLGGLIGLTWRSGNANRWLAAGVGITGAVASAAGLIQSYNLAQEFSLATQVGIGGLLLIALFLALALIRLRMAARHRLN